MKFVRYIYLLLLATLLTACSDELSTPENEIREYIQTAELAAENREISSLAELIDNSYIDQKKLDKPQLLNLLRAYFFRHKNIHLITRIESVDIQPDNRAFVVLYAAMTASAVHSASELGALRARVYRFEMQLIKNNQWRLQQASWKIANIRDMIGGDK